DEVVWSSRQTGLRSPSLGWPRPRLVDTTVPCHPSTANWNAVRSGRVEPAAFLPIWTSIELENRLEMVLSIKFESTQSVPRRHSGTVLRQGGTWRILAVSAARLQSCWLLCCPCCSPWLSSLSIWHAFMPPVRSSRQPQTHPRPLLLWH